MRHDFFAHPSFGEARDEHGTFAVSSLIFELNFSADGTGGAHHGVVKLCEIGLALAISSKADTIPAAVPSSSSLCCIVMFARLPRVTAFFLSS